MLPLWRPNSVSPLTDPAICCWCPYYTAQPGYATVLNLVNTDSVHGKAVKLRFRGASNADDVYNFTLFLAPGDVWAAEVSHNPANGLARLGSADKSCTLPAQANRDFSTAHVNPTPVATYNNPHASPAGETLEGYVEILAMADLLPGTAVFSATQHVKGIPPAPCSNGASTPSALAALLSESGIAAAGLSAPTTGLQANWSIFNVAEASSWSGRATAIVAVDAQNVAGSGQVVMHPQASGTPSGAIISLTTDPLLRAGSVVPQHAHLPDLSTPYLAGATPEQQASQLSGLLARTSVRNEYFTDERVDAQTDWVFSLPMLRYSVAVNYATNGRAFTTLSPAYFSPVNIQPLHPGDVLQPCQPYADYVRWDRNAWPTRKEDELTVGSLPVLGIPICGAVSVMGINPQYDAGQGSYISTLGARLTFQERETSFVEDGWIEVFTPGLNNAGIPLLGAAFAKATSTNVGAGVSGNFGLTWEHSYTRAGNVVP